MRQRTVQLTRVVAVLALPIVAVGCASSDAQRAAKTQIERAQAAYQQAQSDPHVQAYAPLRLVDAQKALQAAQEAKGNDDKLHLGYLAERKAQLASVTGATGNTEQSMQQLRKETAEVLLQKRDRLIEGHSDNGGNEEFNIKLSQQRADAVRDLLVTRGIALQRIRTKGYGPKFPVVDNDTAAGRQQNRRVEVVVLNEGATADGSTR